MILMKRSISSTTLLLFPIWEKNMYKIARTALLEAFHQSPLYKQILGLEVIDEFFRWCLKKLMHHALSGWMFGYWIWNAWKSRRKVMKFIPSIPLNSAWHFLFYLFTLIFFLLFFFELQNFSCHSGFALLYLPALPPDVCLRGSQLFMYPLFSDEYVYYYKASSLSAMQEKY